MSIRNIPVSQIPEFSDQRINALQTMLKNGEHHSFAEQLTKICRQILITGYSIEEAFINAVKKMEMRFGENYEFRTAGRVYFTDFKEKDSTEKQIITSCGIPVTVKVVPCRTSFDAQKPFDFLDYGKVVIDKQLTIQISDQELDKLACSKEMWTDLVNMIRSKVGEETTNMIYEEIMCAINDSRNYKKIEEIQYCCNKCEGSSFISALTTFVLKQQRNTGPYNLQGRDYNLPVNKMWLLSSYDFYSRVMGVLSGKINPNLINIFDKFERVDDVDLKIADIIIIDHQWIQFIEKLNTIEWSRDAVGRAECGVVNYKAMFKLINFMFAVPIKFVKIDCAAKEQAEKIRMKIVGHTADIPAETESAAKTAIEKIISDAKGESKLVVTATYSDFKAPSEVDKGFIKASVVIKDENAVVIDSFEKSFILAKPALAQNKKKSNSKNKSAQPTPNPIADKLPADELPDDELPADEMPADEMPDDYRPDIENLNDELLDSES